MDRTYQERTDEGFDDSFSLGKSPIEIDEDIDTQTKTDSINLMELKTISIEDKNKSFEFSEEDIQSTLNRKSRLVSRKVGKVQALDRKGKLSEEAGPSSGVDIDTVCICQRCFRLQQYGQVSFVDLILYFCCECLKDQDFSVHQY